MCPGIWVISISLEQAVTFASTALQGTIPVTHVQTDQRGLNTIRFRKSKVSIYMPWLRMRVSFPYSIF